MLDQCNPNGEPSPLVHRRKTGGNTGNPAQPGQTAITTEDGAVLTDENGNAIIIE